MSLLHTNMTLLTFALVMEPRANLDSSVVISSPVSIFLFLLLFSLIFFLMNV